MAHLELVPLRMAMMLPLGCTESAEPNAVWNTIHPFHEK
jgi:hypothetical protein